MQTDNTIASPDRRTAPEVKEFADLRLPPYNEVTLANGIRLLTLSSGNQPVHRLMLSWEGGTLDNPCQETAKIMAAAIKEGTAHHSGAEIAEGLEYNGAWTKYEATPHYFNATLYGLNGRAAKGLELFTEVLSEPLFPDDAVTTYRDKLAAQCATNREKITTKVLEVYRPMVFGAGTPKAHCSTPADYQAVTSGMVRDLFNRQLKATPPRAYLAGDLTDELIAEVRAALERMVFTPVDHSLTIRREAPSFNRDGDLRKLTVPGSLQAAVKIAIPTIDRTHPDFEILRIASVAFGGYFGSRLMQNIREDKGYTYGINAQLSALPGEGSFLTVSCQTDNAHTDDVLAEVNNEIRRMVSQPLDTEELTGVRRLLLSALAGVLDSPFSICDYIISQQILGQDTEAYNRLQETVHTITPEDLARVFNLYIKPSPHLTAIAGK